MFVVNNPTKNVAIIQNLAHVSVSKKLSNVLFP